MVMAWVIDSASWSKILRRDLDGRKGDVWGEGANLGVLTWNWPRGRALLNLLHNTTYLPKRFLPGLAPEPQLLCYANGLFY